MFCYDYCIINFHVLCRIKYLNLNLNLIISDMHHRTTYMYINFQQNWVCRSVKPCTQSYLHNIVSCIDLQLPIVIWEKIIILDMHHHKTYMCINFKHNRVETQVVTVLTSLFAKKLQVA